MANLIAWPLGYYGMKRWLEGFAYTTDIELGTFILAGVLALAIAVLTISYHTIKAAIANPMKALRYEK